MHEFFTAFWLHVHEDKQETPTMSLGPYPRRSWAAGVLHQVESLDPMVKQLMLNSSLDIHLVEMDCFNGSLIRRCDTRHISTRRS